jgi:tryptophan synthase alpha chain
MTYVNPVLNVGVEAFAHGAAEAGVDGVILPDLPLDEAAGMRASLHAAGVAVIPLVAPTTTPVRLARICSSAAAFVYCVSVTGVTGARRDISDEALALLDAVRLLTPVPRALGFGLSTHDHLTALRGHAEAAVVGSALLEAIGAANSARADAGAERFLRAMQGEQRALLT